MTRTACKESGVNSASVCPCADITDTAPAVRSATRRASCAQDQDLPLAGCVPLHWWSCKAPNSAWNAVRSASTKPPTPACSATSAATPAQVQVQGHACRGPRVHAATEDCLSCRFLAAGLFELRQGQHSEGQSLLPTM